MSGRLALGLLLATTTLAAAAPEYVAVIDSTAMPEIPAGDLGIDAETLGYESAKSVPGLRRDLNHDGNPELILRGNKDYCGTGGCTIYVVDGKSSKQIGSLFGNPLVVHANSINGWPVLSIYSHSSATSGSYTTFVHDGQRYVQATSVMLHDESVVELFGKLRAIGGGTNRQ